MHLTVLILVYHVSGKNQSEFLVDQHVSKEHPTKLVSVYNFWHKNKPQSVYVPK